MFGEEYRLLSQEGHLTKSALLSGLDAIKKANIDDRGLFYSGMFQLSIGIERLLKIVILLDHKIKNNNSNLTNKELRDYGHNIESLFTVCSKIALKVNGKELGLDEKQQKILQVLSSFSKGARYYNLDELTEYHKNSDPLKDWSKVIDEHIWTLKPSIRKKLEQEALFYCDNNRLGGSYYSERNINGQPMTMLEYHYFLHATSKASYHIIWSIISMLSPFYHLLQELTYEIHNIESEQGIKESIPFMYEFFPFLLSFKHQVLRKKQWSWDK